MAGVVSLVSVTSCSTSSPPDHAPSAPKSTSFTLNTAGAAVGSGVQMSIRKLVMAPASIVAEVNSMPAKARLVYFFIAFPAIASSDRSAASHSADQVSTVTSV